jgi:hypothetical protein
VNFIGAKYSVSYSKMCNILEHLGFANSSKSHHKKTSEDQELELLFKVLKGNSKETISLSNLKVALKAIINIFNDHMIFDKNFAHEF